MHNVRANGNEGNIEIPGKKFPLYVSFGTSNWVYRRDYHNLLEDARNNSLQAILEYSGSTQRVMHTLSIHAEFRSLYNLDYPDEVHGGRTPRVFRDALLENSGRIWKRGWIVLGSFWCMLESFPGDKDYFGIFRKNSGPAEY